MSFQRAYNGYNEWAADIVATAGANTPVPLPDHPCDEVTIIRLSTDVQLNVQNCGQAPAPTKFVTLDVSSGTVIGVAGNSNEISVWRTDGSATPATVRFLYRKYRR